MATLCFWPPLNSFGLFVTWSSKPTISAKRLVRSWISASSYPQHLSGNAIFWITFRRDKREKFWKTNPISFLTARASLRFNKPMFSPSIKILPSSKSFSPEIQSRRVVFPEPLLPIMPKMSPSWIWKFRSLRTVLPSYCLLKWSTLIIISTPSIFSPWSIYHNDNTENNWKQLVL